MKLLSGGQSGVDRAVLDVALARGIPCGGWCPKGGWAEDFPEPPGVLAKYPQLAETPLADPAQRTEWNVRDADGCLILVDVDGLAVSRGTALARDQAAHYGKPLFIADLGAADGDRAAAWLGAQCVADDEAPRSSSGSASSTDQGGGKRRTEGIKCR